MTPKRERLYEIAQRLDELAEEIGELSGLSDELGSIADAWPEEPLTGQMPSRDKMPRWLAQIESIVNREFEERIYGRRGGTHDHNPWYEREYREQMYRELISRPGKLSALSVNTV